jgi:hypothetical protein
MPHLNHEHRTDEKGAQQVHPDKPPREDDAAQGDPNETPRGRPQHEARDPDDEEW